MKGMILRASQAVPTGLKREMLAEERRRNIENNFARLATPHEWHIVNKAPDGCRHKTMLELIRTRSQYA